MIRFIEDEIRYNHYYNSNTILKKKLCVRKKMGLRFDNKSHIET